MADKKDGLSEHIGESELSKEEQKFVDDGLMRNAPVLFLVQHLWECRLVGISPVFDELDKLSEKVQRYIIDSR